MKIRIVNGTFGKNDIIFSPGFTVRQLKRAVEETWGVSGARLFFDNQELVDDSLIIDWMDGGVVHVEVPIGAAAGVGVNRQGYPGTNTNQQPANRFMQVAKMPDDNSCLFHAIKHCVKTHLSASDLRRLVSAVIRNNPWQFTDIVLDRPRLDYITWIEGQGWGGGIEVSILADHFQCEMAVVDVQSGNVNVFSEGRSYPYRIYLLYSGIHYDALELNDGLTKFPPNDAYAINCAKEIAGEARKRHLYTNTKSFTIECELCGAKLKGEREAEHHAEMFNHTHFKEI